MGKEEWKIIEDYPNYMISNRGNVKSLNYNRTGKEKILKQAINKGGYYQIDLCKEGKAKKYLVHRLVVSAFLPNPDNLLEVNHKDENPSNNCIENLEWCTAKYNTNYGTRNKRIGKANSIAKKGKKQSQEHIEKCAKAHQKPILQFSKSGNIILHKWDSLSQASNELKISCGNIANCLKGKRKSAGKYKWVYLEDYVNKMNNYFDLVLKEVS